MTYENEIVYYNINPFSGAGLPSCASSLHSYRPVVDSLPTAKLYFVRNYFASAAYP